MFRYIRGIKVLPEFKDATSIKRGGSRKRAKEAWQDAAIEARNILGNDLFFQQRMCILACLYWGEGNKKELCLINSDPGLIKVFVTCLKDLGITNDQLKINLRLHDNIDRNKAVTFWSKLLSIRKTDIGNIEIIHGKKNGKLRFGMCRVRVAKSATYFKLVMSLIEEIKAQFDAAVVQRIEQGTPKP